MTNENTETKTEDQNKGKKPSHIVYHVTNFGKDDKNSKWDAIGAAWEHKDGKGFNVELKLFPIDGKLSIRPRKVKEENAS